MADCLGMSAASVCNIVRSISTALCAIAQTYIKFPEPTDIPDLASNFFDIAGMPGVIGCIDGSYINIISPGGDNAELYRSRKGRFAINLMAICDYNLVFRNIICSWPGSVHDSRVFDNSRVCQLLEEGNYSGYLLGDSGYPCRKYLMTPLLSPTTEKERKYNTAHIKTRNVIERAFGVLKRRFAILNKEMRTKLCTTKKIIMACVILHNIALQHNIPMNDEMDEDEVLGNEIQNINAEQAVPIGNAASGLVLRSRIIENWF